MYCSHTRMRVENKYEPSTFAPAYVHRLAARMRQVYRVAICFASNITLFTTGANKGLDELAMRGCSCYKSVSCGSIRTRPPPPRAATVLELRCSFIRCLRVVLRCNDCPMWPSP